MGLTNTMNLVRTALLVALGVTLPLAFHFFGAAGSVFLPMHIPILLAGLLLGAKAGAVTGVLAPLLSSLFTGMPPLAVLPFMVVELMLYGAVSGYLYYEKQFSILTALAGAMLIGRLGAVLVVALAAPMFHIEVSPLAYLMGAVVSGIPGIIVQIVFIPLVVKRLKHDSIL